MGIRSYHLSKLLEEQPNKTCFILVEGEIVFDSEYHGVRPMMDYYKLSGKSDKELIIIDRIMGKGAVVLAVHIGAVKIITPIISEIALDFADKHQLDVEYDKLVPYIINRTRDGQCPIEKSVAEIDDVEEGFQTIVKTLKALAENNRRVE